MLTNCPKCGFSQPKDRYCASCGVDIESYRPAPQSLRVRFWNNPTAPVGLTLAVVIFSVWYVRNQFRLASPPVIETHRTFVRSAPSGAPPSAKEAEAPTSVNPTAAIEPTAVKQSPGGSTQTGEGTVTAAFAGGPAGDRSTLGGALGGAVDTATPSAEGEGESVPLRFTFLEIPKGLLTRLLEVQGKSSGRGLSKLDAGTLWDFVSQNPDSELYSLIQAFQSQDKRGGTKKWIIGDHSEDEVTGNHLVLKSEVTLRSPASAKPGGSLAGAFQLNSNLKLTIDGQPHTKEKSDSVSFSFKPGNLWIYKVDLPRTEPSPGHSPASSGVQRVYHSQEFLRSQTDVALIIEMERPAE